MTDKPSAPSGGFGLLDFVVLIAMAVVAVAFAAGLILNSGIDAIAGAIAGAALFMVMASSHFVITRSLRTASVSGRLDDMEEALVALDTDLQRIDQVEDDVARLDLLNDKVERLDNALADFEGGSDLAGSARFERLSGELERLQERVEVLRSEVETVSRAQREEIGAELRSLEDMIKAFSSDLTASAAPGAEPPAPSPAPEPMSVPEAMSLAERMSTPEPMSAPESLMQRLQEEARLEEEPDTEPEAMTLAEIETVVIDAIDDALEEEEREEEREQEESEREEEQAEFAVDMTEDITLDLVEDEPTSLEFGDEAPDLADEELAAEEADAFELPIEEEAAPVDAAEEEAVDLAAEAAAIAEPELEEPAPFDLTVAKPAPFERSMDRPAPFDLPEEDAPFDPDLLPVLRKAIEANRVDLYLRPIVTLPERKLRYCDAVARVRTDSGELVGEDRYRRVAELAGLLPRIDNVMLVKSVQLLRRLGPESKLKRVFCGLSAPSLLDSDFFPELVEFLEENSALGESLTFQLSQRAIADLGEGELTSLRTLGKLGFCFSLDRIAHLDLDYGALRDYFFRFIKIDAKTFLSAMDSARAPVGAADMASYLDRFDLKLIVDNVADEASIAALLDYGVELAAGDLFAVPMPVSAEMFRELDSADAA
jgi:cyclic-di-GMP phosphodiesterase TipF (flagellum assembly factor)